MNSTTSTILSLVVVVAAACTTGARDHQAPPAQHVAGQLIVKFRTGSAGAIAVEQALETGSEHHALLAGYVRELGAKLGTPLRVERLRSGNELLVSIDSRRLTEDAAQRLLAIDAIGDVETIPRDTSPRETAIQMRVSFWAGGDDARVLASAWRSDAKTDERLDHFVRATGQRLDLPLTYRLESPTELIVLINLSQLTQTLAARLGALEDVEFAELNQIMQHSGSINP